MKPILYKENETNFNANGIATLVEAVSCEVTEARNGAFQLGLEYPVDGQWFSEIKEMRIIRAKPNDVDDLHNFRIYDVKKDSSSGNLIVSAVTKSNDLGGNLVESVKVTNKTPQQAMTQLKAALIESVDYSFVSDITTQSSTEWTMQNPLNAIVGEEGSVVQIWGGEVKRTDDTIYVYSRRGTDKVAVIRPGKGMTGFSMTTSTKGLVTRMLPYATYRDEKTDEETMIIGTIVDSQYKNNYPFSNITPVDFSHNADGTEITTKAQLDAVAKTYFTDNTGIDKPNVEIEVDLLQLADTEEYEKFRSMEHIGLTDTVVVYVPKYDIDAEVKVTELVYNSLSEKVTSFTAGDSSSTFYESTKKEYDKTMSDLQTYISKTENGLRNTIQISANGKNKVFRGYTEPAVDISHEGDLWFKELGNDEQEIRIFDGVYWQPLMTAGINAETQAALDLAQQEIDLAKEDLKAVDEAMKTVETAMAHLEVELEATKTATADAQKAADDAQIAADDAREVGRAAQEAGDQALSLVDQAQKDIDLANETIGAHTIDLSKLFSDFANMDTVVDAIVIDTGEMKTAISDNEAAIKIVKTEANKAIAENAADIITAQQVADSAKAKADAVEATTHTITEDLDGITETITEIESTATSTTKTLNEVKSTVDGHTQTIATVKSTADSALSKSNTNSNTIDGIQTTLTETKTTATSALTKANTAQSTADGNTSKITSVTTTANSALSKANTAQSTADGNTAKITSVTTTANSALSKANTLEETVDGVTRTITSVQSDLENISQGNNNLLRNSSMSENTIGWTINSDLNGVIKDGYLLLDKQVATASRSSLNYDTGNRLIDFLEVGTEYSLGFAYYVESVSQTGDFNTVFLRTQYGTTTLYDIPIHRLDLSETGVWKWVFANGSTQTGRGPITRATFTVALDSTTIARVRVKEFILIKGRNVKEWSPNISDLATTTKVNTISDTVDGHTQLIASTKTTADSALSKANSAQSTADGNTSKITSVQTTAESALSKANITEQTVDGMKTTLTSVEKNTANWNTYYQVNTATPKEIKELNGAGLDDRYMYEISAQTLQTGTVSRLLVRLKPVQTSGTGGQGWTLEILDQLSVYSNHPRIYLDETTGKPMVTLWNHASLYNVFMTVTKSVSSINQGVYLETTVDGVKTTVASVKTTADSALTKATTTETTVNGLKTTVSDVQTTTNSALTKAMQVEQTASSIQSTVTDVQNSIADVVNFFPDPKFTKQSPKPTVDGSINVAYDASGVVLNNTGTSYGRVYWGVAAGIILTVGKTYYIKAYLNTGGSGVKVEIGTSGGENVIHTTDSNDAVWVHGVIKATIYTALSVMVPAGKAIRLRELYIYEASTDITSSQITQLSDDINLKVAKNDVVNQINVSTESILISGNKVQITGTTTISNGVIKTAHIADANISTAKIADLAVANGKIDNLAVTEGKIGALAVTNAKIGSLAVTVGKIGDLAVTDAKIGNLAVTNAKLASLAVTEAKIATAAITTAKIADATIVSTKIADAAIVNAKIANLAVTGAKIADATISSAKIISLDAGKITANTLSAITANTGTLNVSGWMNLTSDNTGIRATYNYGDQLDGTYNPRWFDGEYVLGYRYNKFLADVYNLNSNGTKGSFRNYAETFVGGDYFKLRQYNNKTSKDLLGRIDMTGGRLEINDSWHDGTETGIHLWGNGYSWFENYATFSNGMYIGAKGDGKAVETGRIDAPSNYDTLKLNNNRALNDVTFGELNTYFNETRLTSADFRIGIDGDGRLIQSEAIYNRTYGSSSNMVVQSTGSIGRSTSASKYKLNITEVEDAEDLGLRLLTVKPKYWFDKHGSEMAALDMDSGGLSDIDPITLKPHYGLIAEDLRAAGLDSYISVDRTTGEIEGIEYDRLWTTLIPVIRNLVEDKIMNEIRINKLERQMEALLNG